MGLSEKQLQSIKKILIIQHKPFGDILLNTGYLPALREKFPDAQIDYLIQRPYLTILEDNPHLSNLFIIEKKKGLAGRLEELKTALRIRKEGYDLVIDQLRGSSSARLILLSGIKYRLGFITRHWNWLYNLKVARGEIRYYSIMKFELLKPLGIEVREHNLEYHVKPKSTQKIDRWLKEINLLNKNFVVFSVGTPVKRKQWSLDYYAKLADLIQKNTDYRVILLWGPGEKKDSEYVLKQMSTQAILAIPTSFNEAGALLDRAKMLITNDGGINHLAVARQIPSIAIFGPTSNPKKWCAWHKPIHTYLRDWNFWQRGEHTFNISSEQVFQKFMEMLNL